MALIKCSECGKEISDKASVCPSCGCPTNIIKTELHSIQKEKKSYSNVLAGFMLILFYPLGALGIAISFIGFIWACVELADEKIKHKGCIVAALIIYIFTFLVGLSTLNTSTYSDAPQTASSYLNTSSKSNNKVTKENYDLIKENMTEEEVYNILGEPSSTSESEISGIGKTTLKHYQEGFIDIDIYFKNGKVYMKNWAEL